VNIADASQRARALDCRRSFCVTAPAGSGKTELLIQRFLGLLGRVERPEQVLAITFTRKAAAEMRERLAAALADAQSGTPCAGEHQEITRKLALQALAASDRRDWQLGRDMSRLNIRTIDGFCAALTRQMPILSEFGGQVQAVDRAQELYAEAVAELFGLLGSQHPVAADLGQLLLHFDNNQDRLTALLVSMLARRDQWHDYMGKHLSNEANEIRLTRTVEQVVAESLSELCQRLDDHQDEILDLLCYSLENRGMAVPEDFPAPESAAADTWREVRSLFLTAGGGWRKKVDKRQGFPAGKGEPNERKEHLARLTAELAAIPGLQEDLQSLAWLPDMSSNSRSWQTVLLLAHVLPVLAACLLLVFRRHSVVDHSQVALSALQALGEDDAPTELALRLDYSIEHILVDEFQDTAINQYRLVTRLTRGWGEHNELQPQHPRTIFIVGDGMQSIYGFRDANVGLFLKAREEGFNGVVPEPLELLCNFRSAAGVVDWVNDTFREAFPAEDNVRRGRVSFTPAIAVKSAGREPAVETHAFRGDGAAAQEAEFLAERIASELADSDCGSLAVLGRSRPQLAPLLACLRARDIPYAAQDMDPLSGSPAIVDLMSLCRALANPADRVAWFALLRAPWCGLQLPDLGVLAGAGIPNFWGLLANPGAIEGLTRQGKARLAHLAGAMTRSRERRDRLALRVWVEQLWLALGGPATLTYPDRLRDAERFFELLQEADQEGVGLDLEWLEQRLEGLFAAAGDPDARVQVMTLHKAKGLEFNQVFIPALARTTRVASRELLLWEEYNNPGGQPGFLLAADDHCADEEPTLYNFLRRQRREKADLETTRLLYVGATRAIDRLVLSASLASTGDKEEADEVEYREPPPGSLLAPIWPVFRRARVDHTPIGFLPPEAPTAGTRLTRLAEIPAVLPPMGIPAAGGNIPERACNRVERAVGTVVHLALEELASSSSLPHKPDAACRRRWRQALRGLGLAGGDLDQALERVLAGVERTLSDESGGRWVLDPGHPDARCEWPLTRVDEAGDCVNIVIDRSFTDAATGTRWIVDYKTSEPHPGESRNAFLDRESETYGIQLSGYRDALRELAPGPVRCALYFTQLGLLHPLRELDQDRG
jgi:ATP-dependent exoDNAse (exonuclease V) beta subunit